MTNDNNLNKGSFSRNDLNNRVPRKTTTRTTTDRTRKYKQVVQRIELELQ